MGLLYHFILLQNSVMHGDTLNLDIYYCFFTLLSSYVYTADQSRSVQSLLVSGTPEHNVL